MFVAVNLVQHGFRNSTEHRIPSEDHPEGTSTLQNVLEFTYGFPDDSKRSPSILLAPPPFSDKYSVVV